MIQSETSLAYRFRKTANGYAQCLAVLDTVCLTDGHQVAQREHGLVRANGDGHGCVHIKRAMCLQLVQELDPQPFRLSCGLREPTADRSGIREGLPRIRIELTRNRDPITLPQGPVVDAPLRAVAAIMFPTSVTLRKSL